jgi:Icc-related predicted phosphoesterase
MKLLLFSDVHCDLEAAARLVERSREVDVVIGAGDFAKQHQHLQETIDALAPIETPTVVVPGNNETDEALREACASWPAAKVCHGESVEIEGRAFFGLGGGIPVTPWSWSFDLDERQAAAKLSACPESAVLVVHSPPRGIVDGGRGSRAIMEAIRWKRPPLVVCGHIHECWEQESRLDVTVVINAGPRGRIVEL